MKFREEKHRFEREFVRRALHRVGGNVARAAREAGLSRQGFQQLMKRSGLKAADYRRERMSYDWVRGRR